MPRRQAQLAPLQQRPGKGDTALEGIDLVVGTLKDIASATQVPFVADAAGIVLAIVDTLKDIKDNKEAFKHLVDDAYRLVRAASEACKRFEGDLPQDLLIDLAKLFSTVERVEAYALNKVKRGFGERILFKSQDLQEIRRYREELEQAHRRFDLESTISIRRDVAQLTRGQTKILSGQTELLSHFQGRNEEASEVTTSSVDDIRIHSQLASASDDELRRTRTEGKRLSDTGPVPPQSRPNSVPVFQRSESPIPVQGVANSQLQESHYSTTMRTAIHSAPAMSSSPSTPVSPRTGYEGAENVLAHHPNPFAQWQFQLAQQPPASAPVHHSPAVLYSPQHPYASPPATPHYFGAHSVNINSGMTTTNIVSNSNNDFSVNYHGSMPNS